MSDLPPPDSILARAIAGDRAALTVLLTRAHAELARRVERRIPAALRGSLDADDVVQQAFIAVFREIGRFEYRGEDSFDRWTATIAIRTLRNEVKARRRLKRGGGRAVIGDAQANAEESMVALFDMVAAPGRTPSLSIVRREAIASVQRALDELPEDYRIAVLGVYIEGRPVAEVAAQMGRTERAIHNLCFKAKARLTELLGSDPRLT